MTNRSSHKKIKVITKEFPFILIVIFLLYLSGCSTTRNYKVLSFLFDGVPNPANDTALVMIDSLNRADSGTLALNTLSKAGATKITIHPPYQDKQCNSCHDQNTMGKLIKSPPDLCYQCHENFTVKYKVMHGPVGGGQCTMCHNPHSSANADLLIRTGQQLCLYCHDAEQVNNSEAHKEIKDTNCTECHNPHGGENRYTLR